ncbi:MAG TPA: SLC13 family permease [bacterium]|nr:SLC13 family permease [bacterium]
MIQLFKPLIIFLVTYYHIAAPKMSFLKLDRPSWALIGAVLMVATGVMTLQEAYNAIDLNTIALLFGMMVLVSYMKLGGFFKVVSFSLQRYARRPALLLVMVILAGGSLSALFVNDTVCIMFTPLLLHLLTAVGLPPVPYLIALAMSSNIGSACTLTGNPQNMLVGIFSGWGYARFAAYMLPVALVGLAINYAVVYLLYRRRFLGLTVRQISEKPDIDAPLLRKSLFVLAAVLAGFCFLKNMPLVAVAGAAFMIVIADRKPSEAFEKVDWTLLLFFTGLFIVTNGMNKAIAAAGLHEKVLACMGGTVAMQAVSLSAVSVVASNVVSNVPFVMLSAPWIGRLLDPRIMWLVLAMSSTFAGNLTLVGSVANLIVAESAKETAHIGFREYLKAGTVVTLLTVAAGLCFILFYRRIGIL